MIAWKRKIGCLQIAAIFKQLNLSVSYSIFQLIYLFVSRFNIVFDRNCLDTFYLIFKK